MRVIRPIHPFPARMAPELSHEILRCLPKNSRVIDPMCGSGTVLRQGVEAGHECVGRDLDPLAVLMSRAWTSKVSTLRVAHDALEVVERARALTSAQAAVPWKDPDTDAFARYWFAEPQLDALARLAAVLRVCRYPTRDLLRVSFSRLIVTKERGASLARDVSHSRPHRVADENDFDVYGSFVKAARLVARNLEPHAVQGTAEVSVGDARHLRDHVDGVFDAAVTSPPYLNAIDYLRGHRLSLIWFGHSMGELKQIRSRSTGAERAAETITVDVEPFIAATNREPLADRYQAWVRRYASDINGTLESLREVLRPGGLALLVVGNSMIRGASIDNAGIIVAAGEGAGFEATDIRSREIPARRRYLPPPTDGSVFSQRMRRESVITLRAI